MALPKHHLTHIVEEMREFYDRATYELGPDLKGHSVRDLMLDHFSELPAETVDAAMRLAGLP